MIRKIVRKSYCFGRIFIFFITYDFSKYFRRFEGIFSFRCLKDLNRDNVSDIVEWANKISNGLDVPV